MEVFFATIAYPCHCFFLNPERAKRGRKPKKAEDDDDEEDEKSSSDDKEDSGSDVVDEAEEEGEDKVGQPPSMWGPTQVLRPVSYNPTLTSFYSKKIPTLKFFLPFPLQINIKHA